MPQVTSYKCPSCNGPMYFSSDIQKLKCDYCGSSFTVEEIDKVYNSKVEQAANQAAKEAEKETHSSVDGNTEFATNGNWESTNMKAYSCSSCGAELICEEITVSTSCPYCGNPTIIPGQFKQNGMPEYIIPFAMDKNTAVKQLTDFYKNKKLLPKVFSKQNHIQEIKGVYIPFWLYDGNMDVKVTYNASTSSVSYSGSYKTTTTRHYDINREGNIPFEKVPVDGSIKMDNDQMDSLEPYDYTQLKPFSPSYLPGFFAEAYDDNAENCKSRLISRVQTSALTTMRNTVNGYGSVSVKDSDIQVHVDKVNYAFLPVWLLSTKWKNQNYLFAMNGQTGKMVGKLPLDKGKYWFRLLSFVLVGTAAIASVLFFLLKL